MLNSRTLQTNGFIGFASKSLVSPVMAKVAKHCVLLFKTRNSDALRIHDAQQSATITKIILLHEKFLRFDWLRAVVFQLNLKYLHVKITNPLRVVVETNDSMICTCYLE